MFSSHTYIFSESNGWKNRRDCDEIYWNLSWWSTSLTGSKSVLPTIILSGNCCITMSTTEYSFKCCVVLSGWFLSANEIQLRKTPNFAQIVCFVEKLMEHACMHKKVTFGCLKNRSKKKSADQLNYWAIQQFPFLANNQNQIVHYIGLLSINILCIHHYFFSKIKQKLNILQHKPLTTLWKLVDFNIESDAKVNTLLTVKMNMIIRKKYH